MTKRLEPAEGEDVGAGGSPVQVVADARSRLTCAGWFGVFPILKTLGYAACSRVSACLCSYSIGVS